MGEMKNKQKRNHRGTKNQGEADHKIKGAYDRTGRKELKFSSWAGNIIAKTQEIVEKKLVKK